VETLPPKEFAALCFVQRVAEVSRLACGRRLIGKIYEEPDLTPQPAQRYALRLATSRGKKKAIARFSISNSRLSRLPLRTFEVFRSAREYQAILSRVRGDVKQPDTFELLRQA